MLHLVLYVLLAIVVAVGLFLLATRFLPAGEQIAPPIRDEPVWELPAERGLRPEDVDTVRLPVALRGYRFAETDVLLDRLAGELRARDAEIARLRAQHLVPTGDGDRGGDQGGDDDDHARWAPPQAAEQPQAEQAQAEQAQAEQPRAEQPRAEQPQAEQPQAEQPPGAEQPGRGPDDRT